MKDSRIFDSNWFDSNRDDLTGIELARKYLWLVRLSWTDKMHNRVNPNNPPVDSVSYEQHDFRGKEVKHIWKTYDVNTGEGIWRCADLVDGRYCNHRNYDGLELAFETENKNVNSLNS
jgi:hypothetical protein